MENTEQCQQNEINRSEVKYWCFICKKETQIQEENDQMICSVCKSEFVEEIEGENVDEQKNFRPVTRNDINSNQNNTIQTSNQFTNSSQIRINHVVIPRVNVRIISNGNGGFTSTSTFSSNSINPLQTIFSQISNIFNVNSNNFQTSPLSSFLNRHNNNDQAFENLLNFLMMNDPNRHGNPPASTKVILELPRVEVNEENLKEFSCKDCLVCMETFSLEQSTVKLDCAHIFHETCIVDWLMLHNTCPVCRSELKTDDQEYENRKNQRRDALRQYGNNSETGNASQSSQSGNNSSV